MPCLGDFVGQRSLRCPNGTVAIKPRANAPQTSSHFGWRTRYAHASLYGSSSEDHDRVPREAVSGVCRGDVARPRTQPLSHVAWVFAGGHTETFWRREPLGS